MPSGRTHDRLTLWSLPLVAGTTLAITRQSPATLAVCAGFLLGGLLLGPDLDTHSIHYKRWGWLRWIWLPYRWSMRHRSPWSHSPIVGTTVRVLYLLVWVGLLTAASIGLINELWQLGWSWVTLITQLRWMMTTHRAALLALVVGLELGAFSHYTADWFVSSQKRRKKRRANKKG